MTSRRKKHNDKPKFELWRDRAFSVLVPLFLGWVLITQQHNTELKVIVIVLLVGFATGQAAAFARHIARGIGTGIIKAAEEDDKNESKNQTKNKNNHTKSS